MIWKSLERKKKTKFRNGLIDAYFLHSFCLSFPEGYKYISCHVTFLVRQTPTSRRYPAWTYKDGKGYYAGDHS